MKKEPQMVKWSENDVMLFQLVRKKQISFVVKQEKSKQTLTQSRSQDLSSDRWSKRNEVDNAWYSKWVIAAEVHRAANQINSIHFYLFLAPVSSSSKGG